MARPPHRWHAASTQQYPAPAGSPTQSIIVPGGLFESSASLSISPLDELELHAGALQSPSGVGPEPCLTRLFIYS